MPSKSDLTNDALAQIPKTNPVQDDFNWTVPVESIPLPSQGKIYPKNSSLFGKHLIQIKSMTALEEDILLSKALIREGTVLTHLMNSCVIDKSINTKEMLNGDRIALLVAIRITGYGPQYRAEVTCPSCSTTQKAEFDLSNLPIRNLEINPIATGMNEFEFLLPISKKRVTFKFQTGKDEEEQAQILAYRKKAMPDILVENVVTSKLEFSIVSVDGIQDRNKINQFIKSMPAHDSRMLRKYISDNEPGIDMEEAFKCVKCDKTSRVSLPLGISFFWP